MATGDLQRGIGRKTIGNDDFAGDAIQTGNAARQVLFFVEGQG